MKDTWNSHSFAVEKFKLDKHYFYFHLERNYLFIVEKIAGIYRRQTITLSVAHYLFMVFQILFNLLINLSEVI
jgi:hypothetical protein